MVTSNPEIMPMDYAAISVNFGLLFGLAGSGIGYVVFRMLNNQLRVIDGTLGVLFFLSLFVACSEFKIDAARFLAALVVCGACIAYFVVSAAMGR